MKVAITTDGVLNKVFVSCDKPDIVQLIPSEPIRVTISLTKDGIDGKSAYQIAVENGYEGTEQDFAQMLLSIDAKQDKIEIGNPTVSLLDIYKLGKL